MPYADMSAFLDEVGHLIDEAYTKHISATALAPLRLLHLEGLLLLSEEPPIATWEDFERRMDGVLTTFELEVVWPLLAAQEAPDVAAIA